MKRMMRWALVLVGSMACAGISFAGSAVLVEDDFSEKNPNLALCGPSGSEGAVSGGSLNLTVSDKSSFASAAYLPFETVVLADGQTLRLSVDVSTENPEKRTADLRMGLGFADPVITPGSSFKVALSGYYTGAPSGGQAYNINYKWHDGIKEPKDFLYAATSTLGGQVNKSSVPSTPVKWIMEITRKGGKLSFSGSLDGKKFSKSVSARAPEIPENFQFNTVALGYLYARGQTASYDNLKVELLTP